jgi:zinc transport system substrate-binding protein
MKFINLLIFLVFVSNQVWAQDSNQIKTLDHPPIIISSINPIYQIAKFISGDEKNNSLLIKPDVSPNHYALRGNEINNLSNSDVFFYVSDNFESGFGGALKEIKTPPKIVQIGLSKNIELITFQARFNKTVTNFNIWLSPKNALGIALKIADILAALYPENAKIYYTNLGKFLNDVEKMDQKNLVSLKKIKPNTILGDIDNISYFEKYYKLPLAGFVRADSDNEISLQQVKSINDLIKQKGVVCVLGNYQDRSGLPNQIANNNRIKYTMINVFGDEKNKTKNGYVELMNNLVDVLVKCAGQKESDSN